MDDDAVVSKVESPFGQQWRGDATQQRAKIAPLLARLGPIVRDKSRDPVEAEYLRRIGTPERLRGNSRARP